MSKKIYLYDSTLRDGSQTEGIDFSSVDKLNIAARIDDLGIDYIEGGWPGANPTDDKFFEELPKFKNSKLSAFGMTRRPNQSVENDPGLNTLINSGADSICIVGKSWDFHVKKALNISLDENINMIKESIAHIVSKKREALFDAEHFFDGYKNNPEYALKTILAAYEAGARWIILCDTNGGTLPTEIKEIISKITELIPGENLGIHCHNDTDNAVANSLAAIEAGARQIQGTLNGVGERCGNANLISLIPTLHYKLGYELNISNDKIKTISSLSRYLDECLNRQSNRYAPYVGASAFTHKGGLHVSAVVKDSSSYHHISPDLVGNKRNIIVSDQAGKSNIIYRLKDLGIEVADKDIDKLVSKIKEQESQGYSYDNADASFKILVYSILGKLPEFFKTMSFRVIDDRSWNKFNELETISEAITKVIIDKKEVMTVAEGNGPVNALDKALRKALISKYPSLKKIVLTDYKVRILNPSSGSKAVTRVLIQSTDSDKTWTTIGVSANIIDASYNALRDSIIYKLLDE